MPRRTYNPKAGRRHPPSGNPDAVAALEEQMHQARTWARAASRRWPQTTDATPAPHNPTKETS